MKDNMDLCELLVWMHRLGEASVKLDDLHDFIEEYTQTDDFNPSIKKEDEVIQYIKDELIYIRNYVGY